MFLKGSWDVADEFSRSSSNKAEELERLVWSQIIESKAVDVDRLLSKAMVPTMKDTPLMIRGVFFFLHTGGGHTLKGRMKDETIIYSKNYWLHTVSTTERFSYVLLDNQEQTNTTQ